jgi:two-component system, NtrC family, response regulator AtoC
LEAWLIQEAVMKPPLIAVADDDSASADYLKPDDPDGLGEAALEAAIRRAVERRKLASEVTELPQQVNDDPTQAFLLWETSDTMRSVAVMVDRVADNDVTVLIRGESGVGKELVARAIHKRSARRNKPIVKVNCAALPDDLLESELFGHEKGAFTGAATTRIGKFEHADGGTLMLDEIGEMKPALQGKLLHVLQDGEFSRLGGNRCVTADVRIVAATNRDLEAMMTRSEFREDLYYRLKVIEILVPPLRERRQEIPQLVEFFIGKYSHRYNRAQPPFSPRLLEALAAYSWPGNIRELENMMKRFAILQDEALLLKGLQPAEPRAHVYAARADDRDSVPEPSNAPADAAVVATKDPGSVGRLDNGAAAPAVNGTRSLAEVARQATLKAERDLIIPTLRRVHWNRRKAAPLLGVSYKTLLNKIQDLGIMQE